MIWQRRCRRVGALIGLLSVLALTSSSIADNSSNSNADSRQGGAIRLVVRADSIIEIPNIAVDSISIECVSGKPIDPEYVQLHPDFLRLDRDGFGCDTVLIQLFPSIPGPKLSFTLREFKTGASGAPGRVANRDRPSYARPAASTNKLQVRGTKTFYADVSDRTGTNLSQGLSLTLNGEIGSGITVRGSFSDQGLRSDRLVTRRFSELENVYLEAESDKLRGRFGAFVLEQSRSRFLKLTRKIQGLQFGVKSDLITSSASVGVPQGNFTSNTFTTRDGDYGPYRLRGNNGLPDVAVVENSETVWLNGIRLGRGRDRDYYIDYPRGELFFTGRQTIDADDRVRIEFESVRLEYRKTLLTVENLVNPQKGDFSFGIGYIGLLESSDDPIDFSLDPADIAALQAAGDDPDAAVVSGAEFVGMGDGNYRLEVNSDGDSLYVFAGEGEGDYRVSFAEFERGAYIYLGDGRYQFVGEGQGRYLPLRPLPLPTRTHLTSVTAEYNADGKTWATIESALSLQDKNLLSDIGDNDNASVAMGLDAGIRSLTEERFARIEAEFLPSEFARLQRFEAVDEDYLWQRSFQPVGDRQRYTAQFGAGLTRFDNSKLEMGYTREASDFNSRRLAWDAEVDSILNTRANLRLDIAASDDTVVNNRLFRIKPRIRNSSLPVTVLLAGEFDLRREETLGSSQTLSRREGELGVELGGVTLAARQRENWRKSDEWRMLDRKRTLRGSIDRRFGDGNSVSALLLWNRYDPGTGIWQEYQTGALKAVLLRVVNALSLSADFRLSRRGNSQTNQTFLRVDDGEGDYVLIDSVYIPQDRGDYILVTEQVGDLTQTTEAEKHLRFDFEPGRLSNSILLRETSFRYEVNFREIGSPESDFVPSWLLPPFEYFSDNTRFSRIEHQYQWRRRIRSIGLRGELSAKFRTTDNDFDIVRPRIRTSEEARFLLSKTVNTRDNVELSLNWQNSFDEQIGSYSLWLRRRGGEISGTHYQGSWEYSLTMTGFREKVDSLRLRAVTIRLEPGINYNFGEFGRVESSLFILSVSEKEDREVLLQMADNFPRGTHWGGRLRADIKLGGNFSFRLFGRAELLSARENRYFLRTELVSRFQ